MRGRRRFLLTAALGPAALASGCAGLSLDDEERDDEAVDLTAVNASDWAMACDIARAIDPSGWRHRRYGSMTPTRYDAGQHDGRPALHARGAGGNSTLRLPLAPAPVDAGTRLEFAWWVGALNEAADLRDRDADDAVARVVLSFDGERRDWVARDHVLSELVRLITGEPLPDASLVYVWDNRYPVGTVIDNPHTRRVRQLVVQSGPAGLGRWVDHRRAVADDLMLTFGPARTGDAALQLSGLGVMSDANNTGARIDAWFGPLRLTGGAPSAIR